MNAALVYRRDPAAKYALAGGALFLVGTLYVTVLATSRETTRSRRSSATSGAAASVWATYLREWTAWNHVRTAAAFGAPGLLTIGLTKRP